MAEDSREMEENRRRAERQRMLEALHDGIQRGEEAEDLLWQAVLAYQEYPFYTTSGLPFFYTIKQKRNGEYSGELLISRKEGSKTLTKSSVLLAFRKVLEHIAPAVEGLEASPDWRPEYSGPKAIGQIFGISYVYSLFWEMGLIRVPEKVERNLKGRL